MKSHPSSRENDATIVKYMASTFGFRQQQLKTLTDPKDIILEYPRFKDYQNGTLVSETSPSIKFFFCEQNLLTLRFVLVPCRVQAAIPRGKKF